MQEGIIYIRGYEDLAHAIVVKAVEDYCEAVNRYKDDTKIYALERFFKSDWCYVLSGYEDLTTIAKKKAALDRGEKVNIYFS